MPTLRRLRYDCRNSSKLRRLTCDRATQQPTHASNLYGDPGHGCSIRSLCMTSIHSVMDIAMPISAIHPARPGMYCFTSSLCKCTRSVKESMLSLPSSSPKWWNCQGLVNPKWDILWNTKCTIPTTVCTRVPAGAAEVQRWIGMSSNTVMTLHRDRHWSSVKVRMLHPQR